MNRYLIYKGNYSGLIKRLLTERENWEDAEETSKGLKKAQFI